MLRIFAKLTVALFPWESILGFLMELAEKMIVGWLAEKSFTKKAKYFTMLIYVAAEGLGEELVADTRTTVDDDLIQSLIRLCQESSTQQGFKLPNVEELLNGKKALSTASAINARPFKRGSL